MRSIDWLRVQGERQWNAEWSWAAKGEAANGRGMKCDRSVLLEKEYMEVGEGRTYTARTSA